MCVHMNSCDNLMGGQKCLDPSWEWLKMSRPILGGLNMFGHILRGGCENLFSCLAELLAAPTP